MMHFETDKVDEVVEWQNQRWSLPSYVMFSRLTKKCILGVA